MGDEEFCSIVQQKDWDDVWDAIKDYIDEIYEHPECRVEYEDSEWNFPEFPEIPSSRAWLEEKDCVEPNNLSYIIYDTNPAVAVYCLGFLVEEDLVYIEVSIRMDETFAGSVYVVEDMTCEEWWYPY